MGIVFRRSHCAESRTDVHEGGNDRTHAGDIVHIIHQHHKTPPSQHQKDVDDEIIDGQVDDLGIDRTLVQSDGYDRHGFKKYAFDRGHPVFPDKDVMDDLDTASGRSGAGSDKAHRVKKHLRGLRPFFVIGGGEAGGG